MFFVFLTSSVLLGLTIRLSIREIDPQGTAKFDIDTPDRDTSVA